MSIEIVDVSFTYMPETPYEKTALKKINLSIQDGEFIGLIGQTGSGKSTLAQHFNGLLKPEKGKVIVGGANIWQKKHPPTDICRKVGLVFQYPEHQLFADTVFEDVAFGPRNLGISEEETAVLVDEILDKVGLNLTGLKERSPFSLSGGQKRKVAIAGVLVMNPGTVVLDEPTAGLDPRGRREIINLVGRWHREMKKTVVWITHNMEEVARLADRLVVMHRGELVMDGTPRDVFAREEEIREWGLHIPEAAALVRKLRKLGKPVAGEAITVEEAWQEIEKWLGGQKP